VFSDGRVFRLDNFRRLEGYGVNGFRQFRTWRQDKGHNAELQAVVDLLRNGGKPLIPFDQIVNVTLASFAAVTAAREQRTIILNKEYPDLSVQ
ncbi:MAG: dehydrogenase, partial [Verrucomicrobiota bacterium]